MKISKTALAGPLAVALAIPAFAIGQSGPNENAKPPDTAYGVICQREGASKSNENDPQRGTEFTRCIAAHRQGVNGGKSAADAARVACRNGDTPPRSEDFGDCVSETRQLILGLRGLKAQS